MVHYGHEMWLDHCPTIIKCKARPFKYFEMWGRHESFGQIVQGVWQQHISGVKMFQVCKKLKMLKQELKKLNRAHYSDIENRFLHCSDKLKKVQLEIQQMPTA